MFQGTIEVTFSVSKHFILGLGLDRFVESVLHDTYSSQEVRVTIGRDFLTGFSEKRDCSFIFLFI
jgi:hypothetical protein